MPEGRLATFFEAHESRIRECIARRISVKFGFFMPCPLYHELLGDFILTLERREHGVSWRNGVEWLFPFRYCPLPEGAEVPRLEENPLPGWRGARGPPVFAPAARRLRFSEDYSDTSSGESAEGIADGPGGEDNEKGGASATGSGGEGDARCGQEGSRRSSGRPGCSGSSGPTGASGPPGSAGQPIPSDPPQPPNSPDTVAPPAPPKRPKSHETFLPTLDVDKSERSLELVLAITADLEDVDYWMKMHAEEQRTNQASRAKKARSTREDPSASTPALPFPISPSVTLPNSSFSYSSDIDTQLSLPPIVFTGREDRRFLSMLELPRMTRGMSEIARPTPVFFDAVSFAQAVILMQKSLAQETNPYKLTEEDYLIILRDLGRVSPPFREVPCKRFYKYINESLYGKMYPSVSIDDKTVMYQILLDRICRSQSLIGREVHNEIRSKISREYYPSNYTRAFHNMKDRALRACGLTLTKYNAGLRNKRKTLGVGEGGTIGVGATMMVQQAKLAKVAQLAQQAQRPQASEDSAEGSASLVSSSGSSDGSEGPERSGSSEGLYCASEPDGPEGPSGPDGAAGPGGPGGPDGPNGRYSRDSRDRPDPDPPPRRAPDSPAGPGDSGAPEAPGAPDTSENGAPPCKRGSSASRVGDEKSGDAAEALGAPEAPSVSGAPGASAVPDASAQPGGGPAGPQDPGNSVTVVKHVPTRVRARHPRGSRAAWNRRRIRAGARIDAIVIHPVPAVASLLREAQTQASVSQRTSASISTFLDLRPLCPPDQSLSDDSSCEDPDFVPSAEDRSRRKPGAAGSLHSLPLGGDLEALLKSKVSRETIKGARAKRAGQKQPSKPAAP